MIPSARNCAFHRIEQNPLRDDPPKRRRRRRNRSQRTNVAISLTALLLNATSTNAECNPCESDPNGFVAVPSTGCSQYVSCQSGKPSGSNQVCNSGLLFDKNIKGCNWDYLVTCDPDPKNCDDEEDKKVQSSNKPSCIIPLCPEGYSGTVVVPSTNCGEYVSCSNGIPGTTQYCSPGQAFSPQIMACNILSLVNCPPDPTCPPTEEPTPSPTLSIAPSSAAPTVGSSTESPEVTTIEDAMSEENKEEPTEFITSDLLEGMYVMDAHLDANKILINRELFNGGRPVTSTASTFDYNSFKSSLHTMITTPIDNKSFYIGSSDQKNGRVYGLVNIAAFLSQAVVDSIQHGSCDEVNTDVIDGLLPLSNACGQNGLDYQDPQTLCLASEEKYACDVEWEMSLQGELVTSNPPPFFCGPAKEYGGFTGYWDYVSGSENKDGPTANGVGKTDVQGCCWWGRGVLHSKGVCQYGKLNHYLGKKAADEGRTSMFPDVNFCLDPSSVCSHSKYPNMKWITGLFRWVMDVQTYNVEDFNYIDALNKFVDGGFEDWSFIHRVSGIVSQGCHTPPCVKGAEFDGMMRKDVFVKTLKLFGLRINPTSESSRRLGSSDDTYYGRSRHESLSLAH